MTCQAKSEHYKT